MAKSPLFARLRSTLWLASEAEARGISTTEALERRAEARFSRRRALQAMGIASGALALGATGCAVPAGQTDEEDEREPASGVTSSALCSTRVIVVGAGLAGLTAAYRLSKHKFNPRVFEAGKRVGGRTLTLRQGFSSKVELGGELIDTGHIETQKLAKELGLTLLDLEAATAGLEAERFWLEGGIYSEEDVLEDFTPVAKILRQDWKAQGADFTTFDNPDPGAVALDQLSIPAWMDKHGIGGRLRKLLGAAYTSEYGREIGEQSYLNLLYLIGRKPPPFQIFGESDEKYTVKQGNDAMSTRMADGLPTPVTFEHALVAVKPKSDGTLDVVFDNRGKTVHVTADRLVLALPFTQLRKCDISKISLMPQKKKSIDTIAYGTNAKLMIQTSTRPWEASGASGTSFNDAVYHESWATSRGYPGPQGIMTSFTGGHLGLALGTGTVNQRAAEFAARLDKPFPGTSAKFTGKAVRMSWATAPFFEGSYACYRPGDWTTFVGSEKIAEGNIHFCGEHTSTDWQGFMAGAVESGERVAKEIKQAIAAAI